MNYTDFTDVKRDKVRLILETFYSSTIFLIGVLVDILRRLKPIKQSTAIHV